METKTKTLQLVFLNGAVSLYQTPQSAAYVERTVTSLFDNTADQSL